MEPFVRIRGSYVLNLKKFDSFIMSLEFYRPVTLLAWLKKKLTISAYPILKVFAENEEKDKVFKALGIEELLNLEGRFGLFNALYLSRQSGKVVIQVVDIKGNLKGYLKVGIDEEGKRGIEREVEILHFLKQKRISEFGYPEVIDFQRVESLAMAFLSAEKNLIAPFDLKEKEVLAIAESIFNVETDFLRVEEIPFFREVKTRLERSSYRQELMEMWNVCEENLKGIQVKVGLVHGDFKIWNVFKYQDGKPFLIDWEWGQRFGLPGWDLWMWFVGGKISKGRKVDKKDLEKVLNSMRSMGVEEAHKFLMPFAIYLFLLFTGKGVTREVFDRIWKPLFNLVKAYI